MAEKTTAQLSVAIISDNTLSKPDSYDWERIVTEMRKDPTISLVRQLLLAPIIGADWAYNGDNVEANEFVKQQLEELRFDFLRTATMGCIDFGWQGYEKIVKTRPNGEAYIHKLKPLLQKLTKIRVDEKNGSYDGLINNGDNNQEVKLDARQTLTVAFDVEGTNWYGQAVMKNVEKTYNAWNKANEAAERFDKKMAGSHWVITYPVGESEYEGTDTDNFEIAKKLAKSLKSSGELIIPFDLANAIDINGEKGSAWKVELMTASGSGGFENRLAYLDVLKVRALGWPERAILEGQYGTKAEADEHGDFAINALEIKHQQLLNYLNKFVVDDITNWQFGEKGIVKVKPTPLQDSTKIYLKSVYNSLLSNTETFLEEAQSINREAIREMLNIPSIDEGDYLTHVENIPNSDPLPGHGDLLRAN